MYISDLEIGLQSTIFQFADDNTISRPIYESSDCRKLQSDLNKIFEWSVVNKLPLNSSKCATMSLTRCKNIHSWDYNINSCKIERVNEFKLLGVYINNKLTCHAHLNYVCNKASKLLGFVSRCSKAMSWLAMLNLYKALILPTITYCCSMWAPNENVNVSRLERVQRKATRIIIHRKEGTWDTSYSYRLKTLNILSIEDMFNVHRLTLGFKIIRGYCPSSFNDFVRSSDRCVGRLIHWKAKTNTFLNSTFVIFPRLWEQLPLHIQQSSTATDFKAQLTKHLIEKY